MEVLYEGGVATAMQPGVWGNDVPPPIGEDRSSCTVWLAMMRNRLGRRAAALLPALGVPGEERACS